MARIGSATAPDIYPSSDGKPMAESDFQLTPLMYAVSALRIYFEPRRSDVYVAGNLFVYYEEGNPRAAVAPDVFVVFGVPGHARATYRLWQEPKAPDWVLEITSRQTRREDQGRKRALYARLGVTEYWQYDPTGDYLSPAIQGLRLREGEYEPISQPESERDDLRLYSDVLGLWLELREGEFRFVDPNTDQILRTRQESEQARQQAEARIAELEAQLEALRRGTPPA